MSDEPTYLRPPLVPEGAMKIPTMGNQWCWNEGGRYYIYDHPADGFEYCLLAYDSPHPMAPTIEGRHDR